MAIGRRRHEVPLRGTQSEPRFLAPRSGGFAVSALNTPQKPELVPSGHGTPVKKHWIEFTPSWQIGPMSFWVHIQPEGEPWLQAKSYNPPVPEPVPGKGFAVFFVEIDSTILRFSSLAEMHVCIDTLSMRALPSNMVLTQKRGEAYGPSNHWLNRVPLRSMAWPYRQKAVKYLKVSLTDFEAQMRPPAS